MVERRKKLSDVESDNACLTSQCPPHPNEVSEIHPSVLRGPLGDPSELHGFKGAVRYSVKLKPASQHLLD
jgi:hypothetical protein